MGTRHRPFALPVAVVAALAFLIGEPSWAHDGIKGQLETVSLQIDANPTNASLLVHRAELYRLAREWKLSGADLDRAARLNPALAAIDLVRAHTLLDTRQFQAAVDAASRFLGREPDHLDARLVRARASAHLGQSRASAADFSRVLEARPLPDIYIERARALLLPGAPDAAVALEGLDAGIARLGPLVTLELEAIGIEVRLKRYDAALARLERISAGAARKETWLARRGEILELAGRAGEARTAYAAALAAAIEPSTRVRHTAASAALVTRLRTRLGRLDAGQRSQKNSEGAP
jgi:tetratricopeptide (TPR) repeat protein